MKIVDTLTCSALTVARTMVEIGGTDNYINLGKALLVYFRMAKSYFESISD